MYISQTHTEDRYLYFFRMMAVLHVHNSKFFPKGIISEILVKGHTRFNVTGPPGTLLFDVTPEIALK